MTKIHLFLNFGDEWEDHGIAYHDEPRIDIVNKYLKDRGNIRVRVFDVKYKRWLIFME